MKFGEQFIVWVRFLALVALVVSLGLYLFGFFDDGSVLYKPCIESARADASRGDGGMDEWMNCVNYYTREKGWTYDEIVNGRVVGGK